MNLILSVKITHITLVRLSNVALALLTEIVRILFSAVLGGNFIIQEAHPLFLYLI
jgi:hypothetical protein